MVDSEPSWRVCVFCGSGRNAAPELKRVAREFGTTLGQRGIGLVYGGASVGLMGELADAALAAGGRVTGVIPDALVRREVAHGGLTELIVVPDMHTRKARMLELSHAFAVLPGGFGTLDELFEMTTWAQLGLHARPIGLLDVDGFFAPLVEFVSRAVERGFIPPEHRGIWTLGQEPNALLDELFLRRDPSLQLGTRALI